MIFVKNSAVCSLKCRKQMCGPLFLEKTLPHTTSHVIVMENITL